MSAEDIQRKRDSMDQTMPFAELYERSKDDRAIIVGSEVREVIGAYRRCLQRLDREPAAPALPAVEQKRELPAGVYKDKFGDARWVEDGRPYKPPPDDKDAIIGLPPLDVTAEERIRAECRLMLTTERVLQAQLYCRERQLIQQAETIRQLTELVREYRKTHRCELYEGHGGCSLCIKDDLLFKGK